MLSSYNYLTLVSLFLFFSATANALSSCVVFDINWNLLAFNLAGKDYNAGTQDTWASGSAKDITADGRPPFNGQNVTCYLSQFGNAIYIIGADTANPTNVYIYDATAAHWSMQAVTTVGKLDYSNFAAILDHDTDNFFAVSNGELYILRMNIMKTANSTAIAWEDFGTPTINTASPVMALAQNHIHFLDVPGNPAGTANIFVIHYSYWQPEVQKYGDFPATHGQTASVFLNEGVQQEFIFIPDDGSQTYVINVESNTTQTLTGPATKDSGATYFAGPAAFLQIASSGAVSYFPYSPNDTSANQAAKWTTVQSLASAVPATSSGSGSSTKGSSTSTAKTGSQTGSGSSNSTGGGGNGGNGAMAGQPVALGMATALVLGTIALMLS